MSLIRSIFYYPIFYGISAVLVIMASIALFAGRSALRAVVHWWTDWHRWCVKHILGIRIVIDGELADGPVLYVIKHESFFEAIDAPTLLHLPAVFTKRELFDIPFWGYSAKTYGLIPVARDGGASALRTMLAEAKHIVDEGRPLVIFPEGTRVPHGESPPMRSGFAGMYVERLASSAGDRFRSLGFPRRLRINPRGCGRPHMRIGALAVRCTNRVLRFSID